MKISSQRSVNKKVGIIALALFVMPLYFSACEQKACEGEEAAPAVEAEEAVGKKAVPVTKEREPVVAEPVVAGGFYPADPARLRNMIRTFLDQAKVPEAKGRPLGFMAPHAGYRYSGSVAAYCYKMIGKTGVKRFVIMGPSHGVSYEGVYVMDKDFYRTPLGLVRIDRESAGRLAAAKPWISADDRLYGTEHSLEVQIPFLQEVAGEDISIVMVKIGRIDDAQAGDLARALNQVFPGDDVIFIASTDMSHGNYPPYKGSDQTRPVDLKTLFYIKAMDIDAIARGIRDHSTPLCGGLPVLTLMNLFKQRGGGEVVDLKYADSGDATGDHRAVVGYGSAAFILAEEGKEDAVSEKVTGPAEETGTYLLTDEEKLELLKMARACAEAAVKKESIPSFETDSRMLQRIGAAFVTLKRAGQLRGCIGTILANEPLYKCIQRRAVDAAIHDSRFVFNPIKPEELKNIEIEISVLTPPEPAKSPDEIKVGRDGVLLTIGRNRGVFLPQVPVEQGWDRDTYLSRLCGKAGVRDPNCFRHPNAKLEKFQAIVFSEHEMGL
jgi:AmmeMemoRadiSam system protein B/AmmeMemoRadiSam system protein A